MKFFKKDNFKNYQGKLDVLITIMHNTGFLTDDKVESAIRSIPRHNFVPASQKNEAYENTPIPIMKNQTISQPSVVARMTEWLDLQEGQKVLEIGSGSGWQSAILAKLVGSGKIFTIERHSELAKFAKQNLEKLGIKNVEIINGDGNLGLAEKSPFNRIMITAACKKIPEKLLDQLAMDGLLIAPVGENIQSLVLLKKTHKGIVEIKNQDGYVFVPLV
ncbi:MAG: protein-L-isoaspartate(D-aspartate) O-methyltransferase [Candidatus Nitrosomaritimum aestuariumsis]|jgi:protein-L-isoaspartate(D-aspartate) O-methyltransferase|nr:protein-L-isoaspartate(D-aspartate) O-methyltransferase [Nitrosopumilaceae archaeon]